MQLTSVIFRITNDSPSAVLYICPTTLRITQLVLIFGLSSNELNYDVLSISFLLVLVMPLSFIIIDIAIIANWPYHASVVIFNILF